jgi:hypothetical protein
MTFDLVSSRLTNFVKVTGLIGSILLVTITSLVIIENEDYTFGSAVLIFAIVVITSGFNLLLSKLREVFINNVSIIISRKKSPIPLNDILSIKRLPFHLCSIKYKTQKGDVSVIFLLKSSEYFYAIRFGYVPSIEKIRKILSEINS